MKKKLSILLITFFFLSIVPAQASENGTSSTATTISITVVFKDNSMPALVKDAVTASGGKVIAEIPEVGTMFVEGKSTLLSELQSNSNVLAVSPTLNFKIPTTNYYSFTDEANNTGVPDLYNAYQWDIKQVTNDRASHSISSGSHNTVVGIIDTGVSTQHPDLKTNLMGGRNFVPNESSGIVDPADIEDEIGHGSHVAGAIAGNGRILGVAPGIGFKSYKVFGATGGATTDIIVNAIIAAANDKVDVISMSLGGFDIIGQWFYTDPETGITYHGNSAADFLAFKRGVQYAVGKGVIVVAAAGNNGINCSNKKDATDFLNTVVGPVGFRIVGASFVDPASLPGVITVSATDKDSLLSSYSNYGFGFIDIAAPGGDIRRYPYGDWYTDMCFSSWKNNGYGWAAGTSMATPKVSAVAALIIDQYKSQHIPIVPSKVERKLYETSVDTGKPGADPFYGSGIVNAYNALR